MEAVGEVRERSPRGVTAGEWRRAIPALFAIFIVSRILLLVVVAVVEATIPIDYERTGYSGAPVVGSLTGFDAVYYLGIADDGYHLEPVVKGQFPDWVFFPLYPMIVRVVTIPVADAAVAGLLVANAALLAALVIVYALGRSFLDRATAMRATGLLAFAPGAVAFGWAYSDSLFLALAAGAVLAAERRRWWIMGILFALLVLTRPPGILFGFALATAVAVRARDVPWVRRWLPLALGPVALVGFMAYQGAVLGDPLAFVRAQGLWALPTALEPPAIDAAASGGTTLPLSILLFGVLLGAVGLIPLLRRDGVPVHHIVVAVVAVVSVFVSGRIQSDARYLAVAWPLAWALAARGSPDGRHLLALTWGGAYVLFAFLHVTQTLAP